MSGRRSLNSELVPLDSEIERTLTQLRTQNKEISKTPTMDRPPQGINQNFPEMAESLREHFLPNAYIPHMAIRPPTLGNTNFEIKPSVISMLPSFYGRTNENPHNHLNEFIEICSTIQKGGVSDDVVKLRLFPFSLKDKAKQWLHSLPDATITSWDELQQKFLIKFYPMEKTLATRKELANFMQSDLESFHETWERFNDLIRTCPHHGIPRWDLLHYFYGGLLPNNKQMVNSSCGGGFYDLDENRAWCLLERLSENSFQHVAMERVGKGTTQLGRRGVCELSSHDDLSLKVDALSMKFDQLIAMNKSSNVHASNLVDGGSSSHALCALCSNNDHDTTFCPLSSQYPDFMQEHVYAMQGLGRNNNPYSNTYNPGWKNHPNLSWKQGINDQSYQASKPQSQTYYQGMMHAPNFPSSSRYASQPYNSIHASSQPAPQQTKLSSNVEEQLLSVLQGFKETQQMVQSHTQSISKLEDQIGQIAQALTRRDEGKLPTQSIENPRGSCSKFNHEQAKSVTTLRSGKIIEKNIGESSEVRDDSDKEKVEEESDHNRSIPILQNVDDISSKKSIKELGYEPKTPFPLALEKPNVKEDPRKTQVMDTLKEVKINLPLIDVVQQIPAYAKFLKDLCVRKRKAQGNIPRKVKLTEKVSSIFVSSLPPKLRDPGAFTIPCVIHNHKVDKALLDLGSSVNLIPYSIFKEFDLGELMPTNMTLQLADRSERLPKGIVEDVLVKIDEFLFPVDFIVLDMEPIPHTKNYTPILLGRPFLATADAVIHCRTGVMEVSFGNMKVKLNVAGAAKHMDEYDDLECLYVDTINSCIESCVSLLDYGKEMENETTQLSSGALELTPLCHVTTSEGEQFVFKNEALRNLKSEPMKPSSEFPPILELKELPMHLKYAFLGPQNTLPVIIASNLSKEEEKKLLHVLEKNKKAIGWSMADLKGIDPSLCMHRIHLEDGASPSREMQRRLNPIMREIVMKEIIKLLDVGIIYPI